MTDGERSIDVVVIRDGVARLHVVKCTLPPPDDDEPLPAPPVPSSPGSSQGEDQKKGM
jgi:hypothetical protein